jgi:dihydroorotase
MTEHVFRIAEAGDIVTHIYHNNPGRVIDDEGKVLPIVKDAERRGVLFDISFGGLNFSWKVAEKCFEQGLVPHMISSDLQQYNVVYPCLSLANVMSMFLRLGMPLNDVIQRVTAGPAKALRLSHRAGSLRVGQPADITVFDLEEGEFEFDDCHKQKRRGNLRFAPRMAFKSGRRVDCDFVRGKAESNWFMQISDESVPAPAERLSDKQRDFLGSLLEALRNTKWRGHTTEQGAAGVLLDVQDVYNLHDVFHRVLKAHPISMREGVQAVLDCFLEHPFSVQVGLFLTRMDRKLVLERLEKVAVRTVQMAG